MRASCGFNAYFTHAERAFFCCGCGGFLRLFADFGKSVQTLDKQEDDERHDEEVEHGGDERAVIERCKACVLGCGGCCKLLVGYAEHKKLVSKVDALCCKRDK